MFEHGHNLDPTAQLQKIPLGRENFPTSSNLQNYSDHPSISLLPNPHVVGDFSKKDIGSVLGRRKM